jgi:toxin ParE1/3/4
MNHSVEFAPLSLDDLEDIYRYIALAASTAVAQAYLDRLTVQCSRLADFPLRGAARGDLGAGVRTIIFERRITVLYEVVARRVIIRRVFAKGRDIAMAIET